MAEFSLIHSSEIGQAQRWDAEFFRPTAKELQASLTKIGSQTLGKFISTAQRGSAPAYHPDGDIPVIRTVNVRDIEFSTTRQEYVTREFFSQASKGKVSHRDIVVTSTGLGTLGRTFCNLGNEELFADGHITILSPLDDADHCYITAVLQSSVGRVQFDQWQRGSSGQIEIYPEDILQLMIPTLPRLQKKVSDLWKAAVRLVQESKQFYPEAEQELLVRLGWSELWNINSEKSFIRNISAIGEERLDAEHFQPKYQRLRQRLQKTGAEMLGRLCTKIDKGTQPEKYIENGPVVVVKSKNVFGQGIDFDTCERTSMDVYSDVSARLSVGDVVMNSTGFGTLGRAGFITDDLPSKTVAAVDLLKFQVKTDQVLPEYLALFLNSPAGLAQSEMLQTGSSGQLHLYPQHVKQILILLPRNKDGTIDLAWQRKLADKVLGAGKAKKEAQEKLRQAKLLVEQAVFGKITEADSLARSLGKIGQGSSSFSKFIDQGRQLHVAPAQPITKPDLPPPSKR